jgi:calcineurin-like phosphoesterase family protein
VINSNKTWITSDTHYNHSNICKSTTSWDESRLAEDHAGCRNFESLVNMNDTILFELNKRVAKDDILFHLGDWSFGGIEAIFEFRKKIKCKTIHLILGNHDQHIKNNKLIPDEQQEDAFNYLRYYLKKDNIKKDLIKTKDLFTSVNDVLQIKVQSSKTVKSVPIFLSHYSHRVWDKHHKGHLHAFGHSHGSLEYAPNGKSIDVGIDTAFQRFGEYRPYHIHEFIQIVEKQHSNIIDQHGS